MGEKKMRPFTETVTHRGKTHSIGIKRGFHIAKKAEDTDRELHIIRKKTFAPKK